MNYNIEKVVSMEPYDFHSFASIEGTEEEQSNSPLKSTSYFRSERAKAGFIWLVKKCDNYHLIIPPKIENQIDDMLTGRFAQVVVGTKKTTIVFDDLSNSPMITNFDNQQMQGRFDDVQDKPRRKGYLAVYKLGQKQPDEIADEVIEVGRMDLWINRTFSNNNGPVSIRALTTAELQQYK